MILIDLEPDVTAFITTTIIKTKLPTVRKYRILNRKNITMSKQLLQHKYTRNDYSMIFFAYSNMKLVEKIVLRKFTKHRDASRT